MTPIADSSPESVDLDRSTEFGRDYDIYFNEVFDCIVEQLINYKCLMDYMIFHR